LRGIASSAIDISDGLLADLGHILENSGVAATLLLAQLPLSEPVREAMHGDWSLPLSSGDDYELCFTAPESAHAALMQVAKDCEVKIHCVGKITAGSGLRCLDHEGKDIIVASAGFDHFASSRQGRNEQ
jgi:thiamine-monophosphate kinase